MVKLSLNRRRFIASLGALAAMPQVAQAEDYIDLEWADLVPAGQPAPPPIIPELLQHDQAPLLSQQPSSHGVRTDWNGQVVRLPGFILPINYLGKGVTAFILTPFVGACVHVPPPPANQLVFVTTNDPYESTGLSEPVNVVGMFGTVLSN